MRVKRHGGWRSALLGAMGVAAVAADPAAADEDDTSDVRAFVAGDYALVGREPNGGPAYAGTATIAEDGEQLILERRIGGRTVRAVGRVEVPSPPDEGQVLRFHWADGPAVTMTCLIAGDLDNCARLTCLWAADAPPPKEPGLEAMFATAASGDAGSQN